MPTRQIFTNEKLTSTENRTNLLCYHPWIVFQPLSHKSWQGKNSKFKRQLTQSLDVLMSLLFLYFRLFFVIQLTDEFECLPILGFEPRTSGP